MNDNHTDFAIVDHIVATIRHDLERKSIVGPFVVRVWGRGMDRPRSFGEHILNVVPDPDEEKGRLCQTLFDLSLSQHIVDFRRDELVSETDFDDIHLPGIVTGYDLFFDTSDNHETNVTPELVEAVLEVLSVGIGLAEGRGKEEGK